MNAAPHIAKLYRARAHAALLRARQAREAGNAQALRGYTQIALLWRSASNDWIRQAGGYLESSQRVAGIER